MMKTRREALTLTAAATAAAIALPSDSTAADDAAEINALIAEHRQVRDEANRLASHAIDADARMRDWKKKQSRRMVEFFEGRYVDAMEGREAGERLIVGAYCNWTGEAAAKMPAAMRDGYRAKMNQMRDEALSRFHAACDDIEAQTPVAEFLELDRQATAMLDRESELEAAIAGYPNRSAAIVMAKAKWLASLPEDYDIGYLADEFSNSFTALV